MKLYILTFLVLLTGTTLTAQIEQGTITGKIYTSDGKPAPHVNITIKETKENIVAAEDGTYTINTDKECTCTIIVSFVGLATQEKIVTIKNGETIQLDFQLHENAAELNEVIVVATRSLNNRSTSIGKLPVAQRDLPQSIVVIDQAVLERQQVQSMTDVLQNTNGVYIMGTTGGYQEEIAARGYAFSSSNTFKNGSRVNNGIRHEFSSVEKIEVLKGGSAILYGNVAAGGILNIVTKKPKFETGGEVSFRTGSYDLYKPSFDVYGAIAGSKHFAYRVNGTYEKAGSFRDGVQSERFYFNPSLLYKVSNKTQFLLEGDYLKDNRTPDFGSGAINYAIADVPRSRTINVPWAYLKTQQYTTTATAIHNFSESVQLRGVASYQGLGNEMFSASRPASMSIRTDGTWMRGLQKTKTDESYYFSSVDLTAKLNTGKIRHTFLIGADADKYYTQSFAFATYRNNAIASSNKNVYDSINIFDPSTFNQRNDIPVLAAERITTSPITRYGAYVQDLVALSNRWKVLAGIRYSYQKNEVATVDTLLKGTQGFIAANAADAFSPRLGVVYQPTKNISFFTSYTNTFSVNTGVDVNNQALPPSISDQFEIGMKNDLFKGAVSANLTVYQIVNSNLAQTAIYLPDGGINTNSNIRELTGETTSKGIELDIISRPINGFNIIAGYSFNDMRYTGVNGNTVNGNIKGDRLRYNPSHTANASVFYNFSNNSALKGLCVGAGAFYIGDRLAGRNPTNSPTNTNKLIALPDFTTLDVNIGYNQPKYAVRLKVSNLLDKLSYNAHDDNSINPIAPRQVIATVNYKF
ncbi:TonB-dependent receptor [Aridibaculum aurantiacum]|uniref:TonB-dependent receptor n=1 Tax=Aridibaculum aurantiacum TaxID=2810307 RepID=UPI001A9582CB|nr:TonB-dependent receptor [Aridibaculum aurantiacum]